MHSMHQIFSDKIWSGWPDATFRWGGAKQPFNFHTVLHNTITAALTHFDCVTTSLQQWYLSKHSERFTIMKQMYNIVPKKV